MGPSATPGGVNFAVFSANATGMKLCLFTAGNEPIVELDMQRTDDTWHVEAQGCPHSGVLYGVRVFGKGGWDTGHRWDDTKVLLDPYTPLISGRRVFGVRDEVEQYKKGVRSACPNPRSRPAHQYLASRSAAVIAASCVQRALSSPQTSHVCGRAQIGSVFRGTFDFAAPPFDWQGVTPPRHALRDLVIYEMPVRTFTASASSGVPPAQRGSFLGVAAKAAHLKALGVNAVELLPVFEYDELEFQRDANKRDHMTNIWGYSHITFFAPMSRFAAGGAGAAAAAREFKEMVRECALTGACLSNFVSSMRHRAERVRRTRRLHRNGIEVLLDVVYNHTAEGSDVNPYILSHRCIDCRSYYQMKLEQYEQLLNYSGCGNTVSGNHPAMAAQIMASLRHWVEEYHVDGFRFDLATSLCRGARQRAACVRCNRQHTRGWLGRNRACACRAGRQAAERAAAHPRHLEGPRAEQGEADRGAVGLRWLPGRRLPQLGHLGGVERHVPRRRAPLHQGRRRRQGRVRYAPRRQRRPLPHQQAVRCPALRCAALLASRRVRVCCQRVTSGGGRVQEGEPQRELCGCA